MTDSTSPGRTIHRRRAWVTPNPAGMHRPQRNVRTHTKKIARYTHLQVCNSCKAPKGTNAAYAKRKHTDRYPKSIRRPCVRRYSTRCESRPDKRQTPPPTKHTDKSHLLKKNDTMLRGRRVGECCPNLPKIIITTIISDPPITWRTNRGICTVTCKPRYPQPLYTPKRATTRYTPHIDHL